MTATLQLGINAQECAPQVSPEEILVEPSRLACGLWGYPQGDISAAYCADTFPKIKVFTHQGNRYTNCGGTSDSMNCYRLIPSANYAGPDKVPYSYEGESVTYERKAYRLGPKVEFTVRERTMDEKTDLLRRMYAHGGHFASGKTYREMLVDFLGHSTFASRMGDGITAELGRPNLRETQEQMLATLGCQQPLSDFQLGLPGF